MTTTPISIHAALVSEIHDAIRHEMTFFPEEVAYESDIIDVTLDLLPNPDGFVGINDSTDEDAIDYLEEVKTSLDLSGSMLRESIEALFSGLVYTADAVEFWQKHEAECDEAVREYGFELGDSNSVSEIISRAADYGGMMMLSNKASDICYTLEGVIDRLEDSITV